MIFVPSFMEAEKLFWGEGWQADMLMAKTGGEHLP
jgi:hypothetical protein